MPTVYHKVRFRRKLTPLKVRQLREKITLRHVSYRQASLLYGLSLGVLFKIVHRKSYKDVK